MIEVVISKKYWVRKTGKRNRGSSQLRQRPEQAGKVVRQCCLGFIAEACGFTPEELTGVGSLARLGYEYPLRTQDLGSLDPTTSLGLTAQNRMIRINDDPSTSDAEKIRLLTEIAGIFGFHLKFVP